jgi:hypothetical protein
VAPALMLKEVKPGYMERMDMHPKNEYLKVLRERYAKAKTRKLRLNWIGSLRLMRRKKDSTS